MKECKKGKDFSKQKIDCLCFIKKVLQLLIPVLSVTVLFMILLFIANAKIEELEAKLRLALQETEHIEITNIHIEEKLTEISELATMSFEYTNQKRIDNTREILGVKIAGTTNSVNVIYSGVIKVGYDTQDISCKVEEKRKILKFTLPEPKVLDNYIILDNMKCEDENNIFNPIGSEDIIEYFAEIQEEELEAAINKGIFVEAEEQLKTIIENYFAEFHEYEILFVR